MGRGSTAGTASGLGAYTSSGQQQSSGDGSADYDFLAGTTNLDLASTASGSGSDWNYDTSLFQGNTGSWAGYTARSTAQSRSSGSFTGNGSFAGEYDSEGQALTETLTDNSTSSGTASGSDWQKQTDANGLVGTSLATLNFANYNPNSHLGATWCGDQLDTVSITGLATTSTSVDFTDTLVGPLQVMNGSGTIDAGSTSQAASATLSSLAVGYASGAWTAGSTDTYNGAGTGSDHRDIATNQADTSMGSQSQQHLLESGSGSWQEGDSLTSSLADGVVRELYQATYHDDGIVQSVWNGHRLQNNGGRELAETANSHGQSTWSDDASASVERTTPENPSLTDPAPQWVRTSAAFHFERSNATSYHDHVRDESHTLSGDPDLNPGTSDSLSLSDATGWSRSSIVVNGTLEDYAYVTRSSSRDDLNWNGNTQSSSAPRNKRRDSRSSDLQCQQF